MANEIIQGDSGTVLSLTIQDDSQVVDLTNATVEVAIKFKATGILKEATITDAVNGVCEITLDEVDIPHEGVYSFQATVRFTDGKKFSSNIQRFTVLKKLNYTPNVGGGNSDIGGSTTNGNIIINGLEVKVYDDSTIRSEINSLKNGKHTHSNLEDLERIGINANNNLTIDGVEIDTGGTGETHNHSNQSTLDKLTDDGTNLLFNGSPISGGSGGTIPSNVIYFEDWVAGESVAIDTGSTLPPADTTAPNNVTNLSTSNVAATSLTLSWTASTSTDIAGYDIYNGSSLLTTITGTTHNVTGLTEKTQYTFTVKAKDTNGNIASGTSVTVTTADVTAPDNVSNLSTSNLTATSVTLSWTTSTSTDVSGYEIYNGSTLLGTVTGTSYSVSGLTANTAYTFTVKAKDASNNIASGTSVNVTTSSVADTTAPNPVTNLTAGTVTSNSIPVSWTLSTSSDVANYEVAYSTNGTNYTVSSSVVNASSTSYTVTGLTASTNYTIRVVAIDGAGNRSTAVIVNTTTSAPADTTAPVLTITPAATFTTSQTVTMSTNETADIWYTIDGSDPVSSGTRVKYSSALNLTVTTTVKAYAIDTAGNSSAVQVATYTKETVTSGGYVNDSSLTFIQTTQSNEFNIPNPENFFGGTGQWTFFSTVDMTSNMYWIRRENEADTNFRITVKLNPSNQLSLTFRGKTATNTDSWITITASASTVVDINRNSHLVLMRDSTNIKLFIDNVLVGQSGAIASTVSATDPTGIKPLRIGEGTNTVFKNAGYYNRALTTEELTQNYNTLK